MNVARTLRVVSFVILFIFHLEKVLHFSVYTDTATSLSNNQFWLALLWLEQILLGVSLVSSSRIPAWLALGFSILTYDQMQMVLYGADTFAFHLLLMHCLLSPRPGEQRKFMHLAGLTFTMCQLTVIYVLNAVAKIEDPHWESGEIIRLTLIEAFGQDQHWSPFLYLLISKIVVAIQLSTPLIFSPKLRRPVLLLHAANHSLIALFLHSYFGIFCILIHLQIYQYQGKLGSDLKAAFIED